MRIRSHNGQSNRQNQPWQRSKPPSCEDSLTQQMPHDTAPTILLPLASPCEGLVRTHQIFQWLKSSLKTTSPTRALAMRRNQCSRCPADARTSGKRECRSAYVTAYTIRYILPGIMSSQNDLQRCVRPGIHKLSDTMGCHHPSPSLGGLRMPQHAQTTGYDSVISLPIMLCTVTHVWTYAVRQSTPNDTRRL